MADREPIWDAERSRETGRMPPPAVRESPEASALRLAASMGNQAFGRLLASDGGTLPAGRVHPEVEAAIARTRGSGGALDAATQARVGDAVGDPLADVRVHTDAAADGLARSVGARAFTTGSDVYFAQGEYQPGTADGSQLIAHELTHVAQQRGAPTSGPLTMTEPGDAFEREADQVSRDLG